jgi:KDO2-lipid IV(A) lauroyltransferase
MFATARERAVGFGFAAGWNLVKAMPPGMSRRAFQAAADAATVRNGVGTRQLRKNLRRVVGAQVSELRMDALVGEALRSYSRYWLETFRFETMDHAAIAANTRLAGNEHVVAGLERGNGVIFALPHSGNWDAAGIWLVHAHGPFATVAERLRPASVFDRFVAYRQSIGMDVIPLTGGEQPPASLLGERLRKNGLVCLLADRDLSHTGIEVTFFGEQARMPSGPALLAARTGAALLPTHAYYDGTGWGLTMDPPVTIQEGRLRAQVQDATQALADAFARRIAEHPEDWHMLQRLWLADLDGPVGG